MLSAREFAVLEHLLRRSGKVVARSLLESSLFGLIQEVGSNAVEVYVHRLRRHLIEVGASVQVHTVRGVGYMISEGSFASPTEAQPGWNTIDTRAISFGSYKVRTCCPADKNNRAPGWTLAKNPLAERT